MCARRRQGGGRWPVLGGLLLIFATSRALAGPLLAVAPIAGPKKSGAPVITAALKQALSRSGFTLLRADVASAEQAKAKGAQIFVSGSISPKKGKLELVLEAVDLANGQVLGSIKKRYKNKAAARVGETAGLALARRISQNEPPAKKERLGGPIIADSKALGASDEPDPTPGPTGWSLSSGGGAKPEPEPDNGGASPKKALVLVQPEPALAGPKLVTVTLTAGAQLGTDYTVTVGDEPTGLTYSLSPLLLVSGSVRFEVPSLPLVVFAEFGFSPVQYALDIEPEPPEPNQPSGSFIDFGGGLGWHLDLLPLGETGSLYLEPRLGIRISLFNVEEQDPAIVLATSAVLPQIVARLGARIADLDIALDARFRWIASYSESPVDTGSGGSGLGFDLGLEVFYWLTPMFGANLRAGYEFSRVGLDGEGRRVVFEGDPELLNAAVFFGRFLAQGGLAVAF